MGGRLNYFRWAWLPQWDSDVIDRKMAADAARGYKASSGQRRQRLLPTQGKHERRWRVGKEQGVFVDRHVVWFAGGQEYVGNRGDRIGMKVSHMVGGVEC